MMNKNIKAVCFDFGGVIELNGRDIIKDIAELLGIPLIKLREEYFKHNHLTNVGNMSWEDMVIKIVSIFDNTQKTKETVLAMIEKFQSAKKINSDLVAIFPMLQQQGLKVAIFSNNNSGLREKLTENGIIKLVDEVIISSEIGFQKPHKEAFQVLFEKLGVRPEEVVFVDDTPKSLEKADEIGYTPILFKNNEQLKADLQNLGIKL
jgi:putative hydrolase of the HAD superfamily